MQQAYNIAEKKRREAERAAQAEAAARDMVVKQALQRQREELERQEQAARAERQRLLDVYRAKKAEEDKKKQEQVRIKTKLRTMGVCVQGFQWIQQPGGYRCAGGAHWVTNSQLK